MSKTIERKTTVFPLGTYYDATVSVSDPCYLDADWSGPLAYGGNHLAAVDEKPLADGAWEGYAVSFDDGTGWGERVWYAGIRLVDQPTADKRTESVQGVDAGFVGFFINQPELTYDGICDHYLRGEGIASVVQTRAAAFATGSGVGDGAYLVTTYWRDGKIIGIEADYYGEE